MGDEEQRGELHGDVDVLGGRPNAQRIRCGDHAEHGGGEDEVEEVSLETDRPVGGEVDHSGGHQHGRELRGELGDEVGDGGVGACGVLANEDGALEGKSEEHRLKKGQRRVGTGGDEG